MVWNYQEVQPSSFNFSCILLVGTLWRCTREKQRGISSIFTFGIGKKNKCTTIDACKYCINCKKNYLQIKVNDEWACPQTPVSVVLWCVPEFYTSITWPVLMRMSRNVFGFGMWIYIMVTLKVKIDLNYRCMLQLRVRTMISRVCEWWWGGEDIG